MIFVSEASNVLHKQNGCVALSELIPGTHDLWNPVSNAWEQVDVSETLESNPERVRYTNGLFIALSPETSVWAANMSFEQFRMYGLYPLKPVFGGPVGYGNGMVRAKVDTRGVPQNLSGLSFPTLVEMVTNFCDLNTDHSSDLTYEDVQPIVLASVLVGDEELFVRTMKKCVVALLGVHSLDCRIKDTLGFGNINVRQLIPEFKDGSVWVNSFIIRR